MIFGSDEEHYLVDDAVFEGVGIERRTAFDKHRCNLHFAEGLHQPSEIEFVTIMDNPDPRTFRVARFSHRVLS